MIEKNINFEKIKQIILVDNLYENIYHFLYQQKEVTGNTKRKICVSIVSEIDRWSEQYLISESHICLDGINGWYWHTYIGELLPCKIEQNLEDIYKILLIGWGLVVTSEDWKFMSQKSDEAGAILENLERHFNLVQEKCEILNKEEFIAVLQERYLISKKNFQIYQKGSSINLKVIEWLQPQYIKFLDRMKYLKNNISYDCKIIRLNDFGYDETVWYIIFNGSGNNYIVAMEDFA